MNYAMAIDIGGTNIKYALVNQKGEIAYESIKPTSENNKSTIDQLKDIIEEIMKHASLKQLDVVGIGIGAPSVVDDGMVLFANNLPEIDNKNLKNIIGEYAKLPVWVDNDANLMGLGEIHFGDTANEISDAVFLTIGTGVGGALVVNGKLYGGYKNRGGELGHISIHYDGRLCSCGSKGCLEAYASTDAMIEEYSNLLKQEGKELTQEVDGKYIVAQYHANEAMAVLVMNNHFRYLSAGIVGFINTFAPQKIILGGGITESGEFYVEQIREQVKRSVMKETSSFVSIERASLGNKAGFLGAASLVFDNTK